MGVLIASEAVGQEVEDALVFGADPEIAFVVLCKAGDDVTGDGGGACVLSIRGELVCGEVIAVESSSPCGDPDIATVIFYNIGDKVVADAVFVPWVIAIDDDLIAVVFVEAVAGAEPYETAAVLEDVEDIVLGEAVVYFQVFEFKTRLLCGSKMACGYYQQGRQKGRFDGMGRHAIRFQGSVRGMGYIFLKVLFPDIRGKRDRLEGILPDEGFLKVLGVYA